MIDDLRTILFPFPVWLASKCMCAIPAPTNMMNCWRIGQTSSSCELFIFCVRLQIHCIVSIAFLAHKSISVTCDGIERMVVIFLSGVSLRSKPYGMHSFIMSKMREKKSFVDLSAMHSNVLRNGKSNHFFLKLSMAYRTTQYTNTHTLSISPIIDWRTACSRRFSVCLSVGNNHPKMKKTNKYVCAATTAPQEIVSLIRDNNTAAATAATTET